MDVRVHINSDNTARILHSTELCSYASIISNEQTYLTSMRYCAVEWYCRPNKLIYYHFHKYSSIELYACLFACMNGVRQLCDTYATWESERDEKNI